jgi:homoserine O-acetyltransferase/O-succinyltransferase
MKVRFSLFVVIIMLFFGTLAVRAEGELKFAHLNDFRLENGETIQDCRLAYRTFGTLNPDRSNVILFPTWLAGTSQDFVDFGLIGPGKLADASKFFVIAVDTLANGVSSSPSNSKAQPRNKFPQISVLDMVKAGHALLTDHLNLSRIYAVIGISLGGMQAFQWMVSYPGFAVKTVSVAGTPQPTSYDLLLWRTEIAAIEDGQRCRESNGAVMKRVALVHALFSRTPRFIATQTSPKQFPEFLATVEKSLLAYDADNWLRQVKSVMNYDIYKSFGNSPELAAKTVKTSSLFVVSSDEDRMVSSGPAASFAAILKAETFRLSGECGHLAFLCEKDRLAEAVNRFLKKPL